MPGLLTEEALAWIGRTFELPPRTISHDNALKFATAVGYVEWTSDNDTSPAEIVPLPLNYLSFPVVAAEELSADGVVETRRPPIGQGSGMFGELDVTFFRPLRVGDVLEGKQTLVSLEEKSGSRKDFVVSVWRTDYRDPAGELVLTEISRQILS